MLELLLRILADAWNTLCDMSPYLLFGFAVAGVLSVLISPETIERHLGGAGLGSVIKSSIFGVPLPLCSCGVIPVAASLRRHGASPAATAAFLLSTPQTGVDSILVTLSLLGPLLAVYRPVAALATGILGGWLVSLVTSRYEGAAPVPSRCTDACCVNPTNRSKLSRALRYAFLTLPQDIAKPLLAGLLVAGMITALVPAQSIPPALAGGLLGMILMMLVGIPVYVCATASVPIAAALIMKGVSPGAALVFLMTGPATNAATIATVWKIMGRRVAVVYLAVVAASALAAGLLLDHIVAVAAIPPFQPLQEALPYGVKVVAAVALLAVLAGSILRSALGRSEQVTIRAAGTTFVLRVTGMSCSHCADTLEKALREVPGVDSASVNLATGEATVTGKSLDMNALLCTVESLGFSAAGPDGPLPGKEPQHDPTALPRT
ncbi:MAG: SO_0444 family Cu/Zn efflux transporter [Planctomycetota bacterium]